MLLKHDIYPALPIDEIDDQLKSISIDGNGYQLID